MNESINGGGLRNKEEYDEALVNSRLGRDAANGMASVISSGSDDDFQYRNGDMVDLKAAELVNWPIKLELVPNDAEFLKGASIVVAADCAAYAFSDFHKRILADGVLLLLCPKLSNEDVCVERLRGILERGLPPAVSVVSIDVPCCVPIVDSVKMAIKESGLRPGLKHIKISLDGSFMEVERL